MAVIVSFGWFTSVGQTSDSGYGSGYGYGDPSPPIDLGVNPGHISNFSNELTGVWITDPDTTLVILHDANNEVYLFEMFPIDLAEDTTVQAAAVLKGTIAANTVGGDIGSVSSISEQYLGLDIDVAVDRVSENELIFRVTRCEAIGPPSTSREEVCSNVLGEETTYRRYL